MLTLVEPRIGQNRNTSVSFRSGPLNRESPSYMKQNAAKLASVIAPEKRVRARVPGRPTQQNALRLREICLSAALDEFIRHGFAAATIDGVARRAKASRNTVYRTFRDKETLFRAVHRWALEGRQSDLRKLLQADHPPEEMLALVIEKVYVDSTRPRDLAMTRLFVAEGVRFPDLTDSLFEKSLFEPLIEYLADLARRGIADIEDPLHAAWDLTALAGGGILMLLKKPITHPAELRARTQRLAKLVTRGWLHPKEIQN